MKKILVLLLFITITYSCDEIVEVTDISEETVIILAPTNASVIATGTVNFNWETINEATDYQLQIATPSFNNAISVITDTITTTNTYSTTLEINEYEWRVKALNSNYETEYTTNSFTVN